MKFAIIILIIILLSFILASNYRKRNEPFIDWTNTPTIEFKPNAWRFDRHGY